MQQLGAILAPCFIDKHKKAHTLTLDGLYGLLTQHFTEELAMSSLTAIEPKITILDQDVNMVDGLYSLNDMHRIGGGEKRHQPSLFLRNREVIDLADEIIHSTNMQSDQVLRRINGGENRGTYACKEIVYRYAMWISAKFALVVIRTFDEVMTKRLANEQLNNLCYDLSLVTQSLTHAGRYLSVGGNQIKPALEKQIDLLMNEIQPQLTNLEVVK